MWILFQKSLFTEKSKEDEDELEEEAEAEDEADDEASLPKLDDNDRTPIPQPNEASNVNDGQPAR